MDWTEITEIEQLEDISNLSFDNQVALFKHSTRCGVSRMVLKQFESSLTDDQIRNTKFFFLDLIAHRDISNAVANKWDVVHQSPQLILINSDKATSDASHFGIDAEMLNI